MGMRVSEDGSLYAKAGRAVGWSVVSTAVGRLSTLAIGVALARILGPAEFGAYAVALVALLAVLSFNELGVSLAIVRWPGEPDEIAPTVATLSLASSALVYAGCWCGAPAFSRLMGQPDATPVVRLLCLSVLISGLVAAPVAILQRNFRQDRKLVADQVTTWVGALVSIACAVTGMGALSLAIGQLTGSLAGAVLFMLFAPAGMRFGFDRAKARSLLRFGLPLAGSSIVVFASGNVDRVIVGAVLGPGPLGVYVLAANLSNWPLSVFAQPVRAVAPAALARLHHDPAAMRRILLSTAGLLAAVTVPVCSLLGGSAEPVIRLVYGPVWSPAAAVLPWLAGLVALKIMFELCYDFLVVLGRTRAVLNVQLVWLAGSVPATLVATRMAGAWGAAAGQVAVALVLVLPFYLRELGRAHVSRRAAVSQVAGPVAVGAVVGLVAWLSARSVDDDLVALAAAGFVAAVAVGLLLRRRRSALQLLRGPRESSSASATPGAEDGQVPLSASALVSLEGTARTDGKPR
jgi:PST family polysaccharide transporter